MCRLPIVIGLIGIMMLSVTVGVAFGLDMPHTAPESVGCTSCHTLHNSLGPNLTNQPTNSALCKSCHTLTGTASALPFADSDQAKPGISGTSHSWSGLMPGISNPLNAYGLRAAADLANSAVKSRVIDSGNAVICSACHDEHSQLYLPFDPLSNTLSRGQSGKATGGTVSTLYDTSQAWTANQWANTTVKMMSGANSGLARTVLSNTATQLVLASDFPNPVSANDSYYLNSNRHFMRIANTADQLCLDCHYYRNKSDVTTYTGSPLSHPVNKTLAAVKDPTQFFPMPLEPQSAGFAPQSGARGELNGGTDTNFKNNLVLASDLSILCLTCHGMHYAPTSDGTLLRRPKEQICSACHKTDVNALNDSNSIKTHNSTNTGSIKWGDNGWGVAGGKYGKFECTTCHTGHGTKNIYLLKETITSPNGPTDTLPGGTIDFRVLSASTGSPGLMGDDTGGHSTSSMVCEVCHSKNSYHNFDTANNRDLGHNNATNCIDCHSHKAAFAASEPGTGPTGPLAPMDCGGCHSRLYGPMHGTSGYHHFMNNGWTGNSQGSGTISYPVLTPGADIFGPGNPQGNTNRKCLICHVDHPMFRPDINTANGGRGKNLRSDVASTPTFTAPGPGTGFTNTDYDSSNVFGGICLSCHSYVQSKGYAQADSSTRTEAIAVADYNSSAHQYAANSAFNGTGTSIFSANCSKCHNDTISKTRQVTTDQFGLHDSTLSEMTAPMGVTSPLDPLEESLCYRCHSTINDLNPGGGPTKSVAGKDYYGVANMSAAAESLFRASNNFTYATTLYFRETVPTSPPTASGSTDTFIGGTWQAKSMIPQQGASSVGQILLVNNTANPGYWKMTSFVSPAVQQTTTVPAGTWTINMWGYETNANVNARLRTTAYVWTAAGAKGSVIWAPVSQQDQLTWVPPGCDDEWCWDGYWTGPVYELNTYDTANTVTPSGSQVTLNAGDRIVIEIEMETQAPTVTTYNAILRWAGSGTYENSNVVMPSSIPFVWVPSTTSAHYMGNYSGKHKASPIDETRAYLSANKHVECSDCHNPHATAAGTHTPGSTNLANVLKGVDGVNTPSWPAAWMTPTLDDARVTATAEWQICAKCHSSYNTSLTGWSSNWTDLLKEFNPNNPSYHAVIGPSKASASGNYINGFSYTTSLTCSDCHYNNAAVAGDAKGPHRSGASAIVGRSCTGCHDVMSGNSGFSGPDGQLHNCHFGWGCSASEMGPMNCNTCHVKIPHGAPRARLIVLNSDDARYKDPSTPHENSWTMNTNNYSGGECSGYCH